MDIQISTSIKHNYFFKGSHGHSKYQTLELYSTNFKGNYGDYKWKCWLLIKVIKPRWSVVIAQITTFCFTSVILYKVTTDGHIWFFKKAETSEFCYLIHYTINMRPCTRKRKHWMKNKRLWLTYEINEDLWC